LLKNRFFF